MSINLATYGLISALAVGGAVAHQVSQSAEPAQPNDAVQSEPAEPAKTGPMDCNTLMLHHRDMQGALDKLDQRANTLLSQMKDAQSDEAKLAATMAVVEALVTERKEIRDRMSAVEHETIQFLLTSKGTDVMTACPMMTEWLHYGTDSTERHADDNAGGPNDMELGNDR